MLRRKAERRITILYAGRDPVLLLDVRKLLLEHVEDTRYIVTTADTYKAFVKEFLQGDFDMVLLCSSIKNVERKKMASLVGQRSPSTPVIVFSEKPFSQYDFGTMTVDSRPESLLSALTETLKARPHYRSA
jgi:DNA-binding NarL/FixJ family response regulator